MRRQEKFTFVVNDRERQMIDRLADELKRSRSDAVRFVVQEAVNALSEREKQHEHA